MEEQYHKNLYNPSYLQSLMKDTDEKKYILVRELYDINNISYDKGSRKDDYIIRDLLQEISRTLEEYYEMIKYFDNAREGNIKVLEEIIMFFEREYIDSSTLKGRINALKNEIDQQEQGYRDKGKSPRHTNIYLVSLKHSIHKIENRIDSHIDPILREFLQGINLLLIFQKTIRMLEETLKSTDQSGVAARAENLKQNLITFLWLYKKILPESFNRENLNRFIMSTIENMGFTNSLVSRAVIGRDQMKSVIEDISKPMKSSGYSEETLDEELDTEISTQKGKTDVDYINDLMELLYRVTYNKDDRVDTSFRLQGNSVKNREKRFLFHEPGSFKISLKVVSDYCIDSLIFMVSWLQREFKKETVPSSRQSTWKPVMDALVQAEHFIHAYRKSASIASHPKNQSQSVLTGEIRQYIPRDHARQLVHLIHHSCDAMHSALADISILINEKPFKGAEHFLKRIQIARESFDNARDKIQKGTRSITP